MTDRNDITSPDDVELRTLYKSGPAQRVPTRLDDIVMRDASRELEKSAAFGGFLQWRQPAAFAATLALTVALLFQWNETPLPPQNPDSLINPESGFASEAASSPARMREIGETAKQRFLGEDPDISTATIPGSHKIAAKSRLGGSTVCRDDQIASTNSWLECIAILRQDGFAAAAKAEQVRFNRAHPDFQPAQ